MLFGCFASTRSTGFIASIGRRCCSNERASSRSASIDPSSTFRIAAIALSAPSKLNFSSEISPAITKHFTSFGFPASAALISFIASGELPCERKYSAAATWAGQYLRSMMSYAFTNTRSIRLCSSALPM